MIFHVIGKEGRPAVLLIHGLGCNAERSFAIPAGILSRTYRVITVDLDGYDGNGTTFTAIHDQAEKIAVFLRQQYEGELYACLGMSMGGFIAMDMACRCNIEIQNLILDSGYVPPLPFPKLFSRLVADGFLQILEGHPSSFTLHGMNKLMAYVFKKSELCPDASWQTIYNSEYSCMKWELPDNLEILNSPSTVFLHGAKEKFIIKGSRILKERLPEMKIICTGDYGHGELMFTYPHDYAEMIASLLQGHDDAQKTANESHL